MHRIIVCLDVDRGRVVKGTRFADLRDIGDPVALAQRYETEGADEIVFLDISASAESRATVWDVVQRTAEQLFIPLTLGGGLRTADDVARALRSGADKVSLNTSAVERPEVLTETALRFGAQCVVASIDARRRPATNSWEVYVRGGRQATGLDAVEWAAECVERGAGEILLTSIDRDGSRAGYDVNLTGAVAAAVPVPVVASGGAGNANHVLAVLREGGADAALVAGIVHEGEASLSEIKTLLCSNGVSVRHTTRD
jgi:cyclase